MWHSTLNKTKGKKHIIVPIDAENIYQNFVWHNLTFHNKHHKQARNKRTLLQRNIGHTWQGNVIINSGRLKVFLLRTGMKQGCLLTLTTSIQHLTVRLRVFRQEEEIKGI